MKYTVLYYDGHGYILKKVEAIDEYEAERAFEDDIIIIEGHPRIWADPDMVIGADNVD